MMPQVSVLIPLYNGASTVGRAIETVLSQDFTDFELLICDDGSTDNSAEIVAKYDDKRIRYLQNDGNLGVSATRNHLLREAQGTWIALLDADDEFLPGKLSRCVQEFQDTGCDAVSHAMRYITQGGKLSGLIPAMNIFPSGFMARTAVVTAVGGFREDLTVAEDSDLFCKIKVQGSVRYIDEPLTAYRLRSDSLTDTYWFDKRVIEHWYHENPEKALPAGDTAHREWFGQKNFMERALLVLGWYGQRCGRRAAAHYFVHHYTRAVWYAALSMCFNPLYLASRIHRAIAG